MDCLFSDNEEKEMLIYANELKAYNLSPVIYASPDWNIFTSPRAIDISENGFVGMYYGIPIYTFNGLDSHTCCVMPHPKFFKGEML